MGVIKDIASIFDEEITKLYTYNVICRCGDKKVVITDTGYTTTDCDKCGEVLIPTNLITILDLGER